MQSLSLIGSVVSLKNGNEERIRGFIIRILGVNATVNIQHSRLFHIKYVHTKCVLFAYA